MEENNNVTGAGKCVTRLVLRVLGILTLIFVFCPTLLVSCSGQEKSISAFEAIGPYSSGGEEVVSAHPLMALALIIPIVILVCLFYKKVQEDMASKVILGCSVVDFIVWIAFKSTTAKIVSDYYATVKVTCWYVFNMIALILIFLLALLLVMRKIGYDTNLIDFLKGQSEQLTSNQFGAMPETVAKCAKCGAPLLKGTKFCTSCGEPIPEEIVSQAQPVEDPDLYVCKNCGNKLPVGTMFCQNCGTKREDA